MTTLPRITLFYEDLPQPQQEAYERVYPQGIGKVLVEALEARGLKVHLALMSEHQNGLTDEVLDRTDVMVWWVHKGSEKGMILPETTNRVFDRVMGGMGFVPLHSSFATDIFRKLMGTGCTINFRNKGEVERVWVVDSTHPIAKGLDRYIELDLEECYGEDWDIPAPDELVFVSWFEGGDVFRSGCCWKRGRGKVFFFRPGHETAPTYHNKDVQQVIYNACLWAAPGEPVRPLREHTRRPVIKIEASPTLWG